MNDVNKAIADLQEELVRLQAQIIALKILNNVIIATLSETDPDAPRRVVEMLSGRWLPDMIAEADPSIDPANKLVASCQIALDKLHRRLADTFDIEL